MPEKSRFQDEYVTLTSLADDVNRALSVQFSDPKKPIKTLQKAPSGQHPTSNARLTLVGWDSTFTVHPPLLTCDADHTRKHGNLRAGSRMRGPLFPELSFQRKSGKSVGQYNHPWK
jgi:hypothetical protein